eukprot:1971628-Alexandrium_andersonii.AAC.1
MVLPGRGKFERICDVLEYHGMLVRSLLCSDVFPWPLDSASLSIGRRQREAVRGTTAHAALQARMQRFERALSSLLCSRSWGDRVWSPGTTQRAPPASWRWRPLSGER